MTHAQAAAKFPRGTPIYDRHGPATVMTCADGYLLARRKGAMPFVVKATDVDSARYQRWTTTPKTGEPE